MAGLSLVCQLIETIEMPSICIMAVKLKPACTDNVVTYYRQHLILCVTLLTPTHYRV